MLSHEECPYCGTRVSAAARYCDHCGTPLIQSEAGSPRRRHRIAGSYAVWLFVMVTVALFSTGAVGGFLYKSGSWQRAAASRPANQPAGPVPAITSARPQLDNGSVAKYLRSVVSVNARGSQGQNAGSGFLLDRQGHVVTAAHVVEGAFDCITATDDNGRSHQGVVVQRDRNLDIALLRFPSLEGWSSPLTIGDSSRLAIGDEVYLLGSPKGVGNTVPLMATVVRMDEEKRIEGRFFSGLIQVSGATVLEGTSGGPLVNRMTGEAVGVVNAGSGGPVAWAVPIHQVADKLTAWAAQATPQTVCNAEVAVSSITVSLATITPLSGAYGVEGTDLADGAALALRDMEVALRRVGYEVVLKRFDDSGSVSAGREMAERAAYDRSIIGVVGSLDSAVTGGVAEALLSSGLVMVAPTAGAADLNTHLWPHVSRLVAHSNRQEQSMAAFARTGLNLESIYLIEDGTTAAMRQSALFVKAAAAVNLRIVGKARLAATADLEKLRVIIQAAEPGAIYYAGGSEAGTQLIQSLRQGGMLLPILGGQSLFEARLDRLTDQKLVREVYFTRLTAEPSAQFVRAFEDVLGKPTRGYAAYGYDAASIILTALLRYGEENPSQMPSRTELAQLVRDTRGHPGWTSWVTFDPFGENETAWVYLYEWFEGQTEIRERMK